MGEVVHVDYRSEFDKAVFKLLGIEDLKGVQGLTLHLPLFGSPEVIIHKKIWIDHVPEVDDTQTYKIKFEKKES